MDDALGSCHYMITADAEYVAMDKRSCYGSSDHKCKMHTKFRNDRRYCVTHSCSTQTTTMVGESLVLGIIENNFLIASWCVLW
jgi:hypothetical protein